MFYFPFARISWVASWELEACCPLVCLVLYSTLSPEKIHFAGAFQGLCVGTGPITTRGVIKSLNFFLSSSVFGTNPAFADKFTTNCNHFPALESCLSNNRFTTQRAKEQQQRLRLYNNIRHKIVFLFYTSSSHSHSALIFASWRVYLIQGREILPPLVGRISDLGTNSNRIISFMLITFYLITNWPSSAHEIEPWPPRCSQCKNMESRLDYGYYSLLCCCPAVWFHTDFEILLKLLCGFGRR